ncbi:MAG: signal recognition particle protein [Elusimicrobia bacterium RIFOXYB2_FULL_49_7]|nr:MAG: signal recognition particle protein [Elusimicrobia bacterium RIFOXYB2_FULL_49_7]
MFNALTERLEAVFKQLRGHGKLTEDNIRDAVRDVRRALLEADVHYKVAKEFTAAITEKAVGAEVLKSITPGQQIVKIVHDELVHLLGSSAHELTFTGSTPHKIMMVGLQGSGKTTFSAKLALHFLKKGRRPLLVAADIYRPAAVEQLKVLGASIQVPVFYREGASPAELCAEASDAAFHDNRDLILFDTAGRLHIDEEMMQELDNIASQEKPNHILFAADAMTGQDAVTAATMFNARLDFTGVVLTKLDGDARGGAALSVRSVTGKPICFVGVGEKMAELEVFHPDRMASRILGMGDIVSLVEKAQENIDEEKAAQLEKKIMKSQLTLEDFRDQLQQIRKMGSLQSIMAMIPGMGGAMKDGELDEKMLDRTMAIINSMTKRERVRPVILNGSRRKRIALGSGTTVTDVNRLIKQFEQMQKMMKSMGKMMGKMKRMPNLMGHLNLGR